MPYVAAHAAIFASRHILSLRLRRHLPTSMPLRRFTPTPTPIYRRLRAAAAPLAYEAQRDGALRSYRGARR